MNRLEKEELKFRDLINNPDKIEEEINLKRKRRNKSKYIIIGFMIVYVVLGLITRGQISPDPLAIILLFLAVAVDSQMVSSDIKVLMILQKMTED